MSIHRAAKPSAVPTWTPPNVPRAAKRHGACQTLRARVHPDNGHYHARALRTPREVRTGLLRAHQFQKASCIDLPFGFVDSRSSAVWFDGWSRPRGLVFVAEEDARDSEPPVVEARTWLMRIVWKRDGPLELA